MAVKVFISQSAVDAWVSADRADLTGTVLSFRQAPAQALDLVPASLFRRVSAGAADADADADNKGLIGKVLDEEAIAALGGESYMTSVLIGETAYDVEPGFVGTPAAGADARGLVASLRALEG